MLNWQVKLVKSEWSLKRKEQMYVQLYFQATSHSLQSLIVNISLALSIWFVCCLTIAFVNINKDLIRS